MSDDTLRFSTLPVKRLHPTARVPERAHPTDAGLDLSTVEAATLGPGEGKMLATGLAFAIPTGFVGMIADRSSMAKKGLKVAGGIIDASYRGEVRVVLWNLSREPLSVEPGDRVAQMLLVPVALAASHEVESLDETARGTGGFGSTGR
jgi:dUTP pyrophosphatase